MNIHELGLFIAHWLKLHTRNDVAILVRTNDRRPQSWCQAGAHGARRAQSAAVQLMQAQAEASYDKTDYYLYTTAAPTAMCLGMAKRCHIVGLVFLSGKHILYNTPDDAGQPPRPLTQAMKEMIAGTWVVEEPWKQIAAYRARFAGPSIVATLHNGNARAWDAWIEQLGTVREVAFVWLTLPDNRQLKPVKAPSFAGNLAVTHSRGRPATPLRDKIYMSLTFALLHASRDKDNAGITALEGQQIAAVLVGPSGRLLAWGVNTNKKNVTRHGETNCIQSFIQRTGSDVPDDSTLYTTLQSCEMCAGMLTTVARRMRVVYGAADKGIGITALAYRVNGAWEERFLHGTSDPIARANFQRIVAQSMVRTHQENFSSAAKIGRGLYQAAIPRSSMQGMNDDARQTLGLRYSQRQTRVGNMLATVAFGGTSAGLAMNRAPLPNAVTTALASPPSMSNIVVEKKAALGRPAVGSAHK